MELQMLRRGNILIVYIEGEIDHHSSEDIKDRVDSCLVAVPIRYVVFDFSKVTFMDSSGIGMLMGRYKNVLRIGGKVWLMSINDTVRRILEMSGILKIIPTVAKVEDVFNMVL